MPTEPPPCAWAFPPAAAAGEAGLVAVGADLAPGTLLAAYRSGIFPMPVDGLADSKQLTARERTRWPP